MVSEVVCMVERTCNSRLGSHSQQEFEYYSCAWCYDFLFTTTKKKPLIATDLVPYLIDRVQKALIVPDINNSTNVRVICSTLDNDECNRWKSCCYAANACCQKQLSTPLGDVNNTCGRTWDGWGCWDDTKPGELVYQSCPLYLTFSVPSRKFSFQTSRLIEKCLVVIKIHTRSVVERFGRCDTNC